MKRTSKLMLEILLVIIALAFLSPVYIMIVNSFKDRAELYANALALPNSFSFQYYAKEWKR
jgi:raffinose/stachyose/melibiose transport system permease protein